MIELIELIIKKMTTRTREKMCYTVLLQEVVSNLARAHVDEWHLQNVAPVGSSKATSSAPASPGCNWRDTCRVVVTLIEN